MAKTFFDLDNNIIEAFRVVSRIKDKQQQADNIVTLSENCALGMGLEAYSFEFTEAIHFHMAVYYIWLQNPDIKKVKIRKAVKAAQAISKATQETMQHLK